jgi:two-component system response regulator RegA
MSRIDAARAILIVDDDERFRTRLARAFRERGYTPYEAADVADAERTVRSHVMTHAVIDLRLPSGSGLDIVRAARAANPDALIVVLTGYGSIATALEAVNLGATHYLTKPADVDDIEAGFSRHAEAPQPPPAPAADVPSLARVEWEHIHRVLEAARRLGLHRRSLQRKLAKYPVQR